MTMDRSATIMDSIFGSPDEESRGRLLKIIQEFLISEAGKHSAKEKGNINVLLSVASSFFFQAIENNKGKVKASEVNMDELVGNTDGFADSG